jgi:hypothetical protein
MHRRSRRPAREAWHEAQSGADLAPEQSVRLLFVARQPSIFGPFVRSESDPDTTHTALASLDSLPTAARAPDRTSRQSRDA